MRRGSCPSALTATSMRVPGVARASRRASSAAGTASGIAVDALAIRRAEHRHGGAALGVSDRRDAGSVAKPAALVVAWCGANLSVEADLGKAIEGLLHDRKLPLALRRERDVAELAASDSPWTRLGPRTLHAVV